MGNLHLTIPVRNPSGSSRSKTLTPQPAKKKNQRRIVPRLPQKGNRRQENQDVIGWVRGESGCRWWYPNHSTSVEIRKVGINDVVLCEKNRGISENFMLQHHIPCFLNGMKCGLNHVNPSFADSCRCEEEAEEDEHVFPQ